MARQERDLTIGRTTRSRELHAHRRARLRVPRVSWVLLTTVTLLPLGGLYVWLIPGRVQTELTDRTWE